MYQATPTPYMLTKKVLRQALAGILINDRERKAKSKKELICYLQTLDETDIPFVEDDSVTGWVHQAISRFGLTVGDIRKMKFGQTVKLLLVDRNVSDIASNVTKQVYDPSKVGFTYATYIHGDFLTGLLRFSDGSAIYAPFTWEFNVSALEEGSECKGCAWDAIMTEKTRHRLPDDLLVGWRGPCIDMKHMEELPPRIQKYGTWWNDDGILKYDDWTHLI